MTPRDVLERGETDFLTPEGEDVGEIRSLTVAEQDKGLNSGWLPQSIRIERRLLQSPLSFNFGRDEWLPFGQPFTKTPS